MNILTGVIIGALLLTVAILGTGIWSMIRGGEFDKKHSTELMFARVGMQAVTVLLLLLAIYLAN
ncbi:MAG: twin transmembrane helix small protein [Gammaproteobacteria bacterium]